MHPDTEESNFPARLRPATAQSGPVLPPDKVDAVRPGHIGTPQQRPGGANVASGEVTESESRGRLAGVQDAATFTSGFYTSTSLI